MSFRVQHMHIVCFWETALARAMPALRPDCRRAIAQGLAEGLAHRKGPP